MAIEFELKFRATPETIAAIARDVKGDTVNYRMQTTYYDTRDRALSARKCTLRRRMENEKSVCTLKFPTEGKGRGECELESEDINLVAQQLCVLSGKEELRALIAEGIEPVCGARFQRQAITVTMDDCVMEIALDQGVLTGGGKEIPLCEVEVELKSGDVQTVELYGGVFARRYGLRRETKSKFRRAFLLSEGAYHG